MESGDVQVTVKLYQLLVDMKVSWLNHQGKKQGTDQMICIYMKRQKSMVFQSKGLQLPGCISTWNIHSEWGSKITALKKLILGQF